MASGQDLLLVMEQKTVWWVAVTVTVQDEVEVVDVAELALLDFLSSSSSSLSSSLSSSFPSSLPPPLSPFLSSVGQLPILSPKSWMQNWGSLMAMLGGKLLKHPKQIRGGPVNGKMTTKI